MSIPCLVVLKKQLKALPRSAFKRSLRKHMNLSATTETMLFSQQPAPILWLINSSSKKPQESLIAMLFAYASAELLKSLCHELFSLNKHTVLQLLLDQTESFHALYVMSSPEGRFALSVWINECLSAKQILLLFRGRKGLFDSGLIYETKALEGLLLGEKNAVTHIINALSRFTEEELLSLFQTPSLFKTSYCGLVELVKQLALLYAENEEYPIELTLSLLLEMLEKQLSDKAIEQLFFGEARETKGCEHLGDYLNKFSSNVQHQLIKLMLRLPEEKIEAQILADGHLYSVLFQSKKTAQLGTTILLIDHFNRHKTLKPYLKQDFKRGSFLLHLIRAEQLETIVYYLEQLPFTTLPEGLLCDGDAKDAINNLFSAYPLFKGLKENEADESLVALLDHTHPTTLDVRWSKQRTLLHLAISAQKPKLVAQILARGACVNALDEEGISPLDLAISTKNQAVIGILLKHPRLELTRASLQRALFCLDAAILQITMQSLFESPQLEQHAHLYTEMINTFQPTETAIHTLKEILENTQEAPSLLLSQHCLNTTDPLGIFLYQAALYFPKILLEELIHLNLTQLAGDLSLKEKDTARYKLILCLFSMPVASCIALLQSIQLTKEEAFQRDLMLGQALSKPLIFLNLGPEEYGLLVDLTEDPISCRQHLFTVFTQHSNLELIPSKTIKQLASSLDSDEMLRCYNHRPSPTTLILALEKSLTNNSPDSLDDLFATLEKELEQFHQYDPSSQEPQLIQLLQLTTHIKLKAVVKHCISESPSLQKAIQHLFTQSAKHDLDLESLYFDLFFELAADIKFCIHNSEAFSAFIAKLSVAHFCELLCSYQSIKTANNHARLEHADHFEPVQDDESNRETIELIHQHLRLGLQQHNDLDALFPHFLDWILSLSSLMSLHSIISTCLLIFPKLTQETCQLLQKQVEISSNQVITIQTLLVLKPDQNFIEQFILAVHKSSRRTLSHFIKLAETVKEPTLIKFIQ
jgi:ankyrin repeat protein